MQKLKTLCEDWRWAIFVFATAFVLFVLDALETARVRRGIDPKDDHEII
jgi:hypothetical protein